MLYYQCNMDLKYSIIKHFRLDNFVCSFVFLMLSMNSIHNTIHVKESTLIGSFASRHQLKCKKNTSSCARKRKCKVLNWGNWLSRKNINVTLIFRIRRNLFILPLKYSYHSYVVSIEKNLI